MVGVQYPTGAVTHLVDMATYERWIGAALCGRWIGDAEPATRRRRVCIHCAEAIGGLR